MSFNIWEGIYKNFGECPSAGEGHEGNTWVSRSFERINTIRDEIKQGNPISSDPESLLPFMVALLSANNDTISILDFGGGLGSTYMSIISACERNQDINFHIVESNKICETGVNIFKDDHRINFYKYPVFPQKIKKMDIVHLGSSLQYIEDWRQLLKGLSEYNPKYFLFEDLPAGAISTFATIQNYYESKIPHWFFNIEEFISMMESINYKLFFRSIFSGSYFGEKQKPPLSNFPPEYRINNTWNLLFTVEKERKECT